MENTTYSGTTYKIIKEQYPSLYDEKNPITYLDHAGASLYSKSQIDGFHKEMTESLLSNPHTNFGNLKVKY